MLRAFILAFILAFALAGLSAGEARVQVVATNTILADIARHVGGDRVTVTSLLSPGLDAHVFQPTPDDAKRVASSAVVVENGLGLEGWMRDLVRSSGFAGRLITASAGITPLAGDGCTAHKDDDKAHGCSDPHAWQDLANGIRYAQNIRDGLSAADPLGAADYSAWSDAYCGQLRVLDSWVRRQIASVPVDRRVLVTSHAALSYFGRAYGLDMHAVEGVASGQEPDAKHLAELIGLLRARRIGAVFIDNVSNPNAVQRVGAEAGVANGGRLFSDSLDAPGSPAGTYAGMFLVNTRTIVRGLERR